MLPYGIQCFLPSFTKLAWTTEPPLEFCGWQCRLRWHEVIPWCLCLGAAGYQEVLRLYYRRQFSWLEGTAVLLQHERHQVSLLLFCVCKKQNPFYYPSMQACVFCIIQKLIMLFSLCAEPPWHFWLIKVTSFIPLMNNILSRRISPPPPAPASQDRKALLHHIRMNLVPTS